MKAGSKLNIPKLKNLDSGPSISWQIDEEKVEAMTDFIFLGSEITVDGDCTMQLKDACTLEE